MMNAPQPRAQGPGVTAMVGVRVGVGVAVVLLVAVGAQAWQSRQQRARIETLAAEVRALERSV